MTKIYKGLKSRKFPFFTHPENSAGNGWQQSAETGQRQWLKGLFAAALMVTGSTVFSQTNIAAYSFSKGTGATYTPITGGTKVFPSGTNTAYDNEVSAAINLSSPFTFGGVAVSSVYISANGFITFGAAPSASSYTPLSTLGSTTGAISAFGQDGGSSTVTGATPDISYLDTGSEFVVQYTDHANYYNRAQERLNFQIRLVYGSNEIKIVYGNCTNPGTSSTSQTAIQVGVRGNSTAFSTNVSPLMIGNVPAGTTCDWSKAVTGSSNTSTMLFSGTTNVNVKIPNGLVYSWMPGTQLPVRTFTAATAITNNGATVNWTAPANAATYNVQYRAVGSCDWMTLNGSTTSATSATFTGLAANTSYQVQVQALNGNAVSSYSHIPNAAGTGDGYSAAGSFTTLANCASTVSGLSSSAIGPDKATISWTASTTVPANGYEYYYSTSSTAPANTTVPSGSTAAGTVSANLTGLTPATTYYFWVRGNCNGTDKGVWSSSSTFATPSLCPTVSAPAAGAMDVSVTPTITWTAITGITGYKLRVGTTAGGSDVLNSVDLGNVTSYTFPSALNLSTKYYYSVSGYTATTPAATCSERNFTTVCGVENAPTVLQPFASFVPSCWSVAKGDVAAASTLTYGTSKWTATSGFANTGTNSGVKINLYATNAGDWLISQPINLGNTPGMYRVKYKMALTSYAGTTAQTTLGTHLVRMIVSTDGGTTWSNANTIKTYTGAGSYSNTGQTETVNLTGYTGTVRIAFVATTSSTSPDVDFHIDDFAVEAVPACDEPTAVTAGNITDNTASISWTASLSTPANGYEVYYSTSNTAPTSATTPSYTGINGTAQPLNNLAANTLYYVWVRSKCSTTSTSAWSSAISFTTACGTIVPSYTFDFASGIDACWSKANAGTPATTPSGTTSAWTADGFLNSGSTGAMKVNVYTSSFSPATFNAWMITPTFNLSGGGYRVKFDYGLTAYNATTAGTLGSDDVVQLAISQDGGTTWSVLKTWDAGNSPSNTSNQYVFDLANFQSANTKFALYATNGTVADANDVEFFVDNFVVEQNNLATSEASVKKNAIRVYPNPFSEILNISDAGNVKNVLVVDLAGRLVKTIANPSAVLQLGELKEGLYIVTLEMKDGSKQSVKVIRK